MNVDLLGLGGHEHQQQRYHDNHQTETLEASTAPTHEEAEKQQRKRTFFTPLDRRTLHDWPWLLVYAVTSLVALLISIKLRLFALSWSSLLGDLPVLATAFALSALALLLFCLSVPLATYGMCLLVYFLFSPFSLILFSPFALLSPSMSRTCPDMLGRLFHLSAGL